jgi:hypothetical protein
LAGRILVLPKAPATLELPVAQPRPKSAASIVPEEPKRLLKPDRITGIGVVAVRTDSTFDLVQLVIREKNGHGRMATVFAGDA